ncbi:MAG: UbiH/UbiF/VisC/COQ6 family ubiquinone biosynthesis hydroxylase [Gammaproteobacteria bacterium]|jgi:2-octaprenylphenol hydroxylase
MTKKKTSKNKNQSVDIIIAGGGMVGLVLANALASHKLSIAIVESSDHKPAWNKANVDLRTSAVTRASQNILESIGVWDAVAAMRVSPFREMHVWDATGDGSIHFDSADIGQDCLGHIIENSVIQTALYEHLQSHDNVHWLQPAQPTDLAMGNDHVSLQLDNGITISARLIVGADGGRSWVREQAEIPVRVQDYKQQAVVATVKSEHYHKDTAWQRFLPTGPLAFLPLTDGYSSIVWSTTPDQAEELIAMDDDTFKQTLAEAFAFKLGAITETSPRSGFPLRSQHAKQYVKPRLVLIGDAAHTIHPLAGQGANLGFTDAATLAEVIIDAAKAGKDIGSFHVLRRYERWRKGDNLATLTTMTGFKTLFGNKNPLLKTLRNTGLNITNSIAPAKNLIIRHAMGLEGDLPKLARRQPL